MNPWSAFIWHKEHIIERAMKTMNAKVISRPLAYVLQKLSKQHSLQRCIKVACWHNNCLAINKGRRNSFKIQRSFENSHKYIVIRHPTYSKTNLTSYRRIQVRRRRRHGAVIFLTHSYLRLLKIESNLLI